MDCLTLNTDECSRAACFVESQFSGVLLKIFDNQLTVNPLFSKDNFDSRICTTRNEKRDSNGFEEICCGSYEHCTIRPIRYYENQPKECCVGEKGRFKTFHPMMRSCCDGVVRELGGCPGE